MNQELFAICHDGTMNGDCVGDPLNTFNVTDIKELTFEHVLGMYGEYLDDNCYNADEIGDELKHLKGAWIVTPETIALMEEVALVVDPGNDSAVYATQRALKAIARKLAVGTLGENAGDDVGEAD